MNIPQTSVSSAMAIGIVGQLCDLRSDGLGSVVDTYTSEEASASIAFGLAIKQGTADYGALLPTSTADALKGIVCHGHSFERLTELASDGLKPKASFGVLKKGRIFVSPTTNITPTSQVHIQVVAESGKAVGTIRGTRSSGKTIDVTAFCRWLTTTLAGGVARLDVDFTNAALATADS